MMPNLLLLLGLVLVVDAGLTVGDLSAASDRRTARLQPRADEPLTT